MSFTDGHNVPHQTGEPFEPTSLFEEQLRLFFQATADRVGGEFHKRALFRGHRARNRSIGHIGLVDSLVRRSADGPLHVCEKILRNESIPRVIVKSLGGRIIVESTPGKGSVFIVSLPKGPLAK